MSAEWILYSLAVSAGVGGSALAFEHAARRRMKGLRWVWVAAICGSIATSIVPPLGPSEGVPLMESAGVVGDVGAASAEYGASIPGFGRVVMVDPLGNVAERLPAADGGRVDMRGTLLTG